MVGAAVVAFLFFAGFERPHVVTRVLCAGALFQLSPLHGDDLSRLPSRRRLPEIPNLYGPYHGAIGADAAAVASLAASAALDLHHLLDLEPVALQRAELRAIHDVCPPGWSRSGQGRTQGFVWRFCRVIPDSVSRIPH